MQTVLVNTHEIVKALISSGFTQEQAESVCHTIQSIDLSHLATKSDLAQQDVLLRQEMSELRAELRQEIAGIKVDMFKFFIPLMLAQTGLIVALLKFI